MLVCLKAEVNGVHLPWLVLLMTDFTNLCRIQSSYQYRKDSVSWHKIDLFSSGWHPSLSCWMGLSWSSVESQAKTSITMGSADPSNSMLIKTITFEKVGATVLKVGWGSMFCWLLLKLVTDFAYYITRFFGCISHAVFFCFWLWGVRGKALIIWPCADAPFAFLLIQALLETFEHKHSMLCVWTCENPYHCLIT